MASIKVIQGPDKGLNFELANGDNIVGRQNGNCRLKDGTVSRSHAKLLCRDGACVLEDMGSANGTFVNGMKLSKPVQLHRGDQIRCGSTLFVFGGAGTLPGAAVDVDEEGNLVDAAIVATIPSNEDSVIIPTLEAGAQAIDNLRILYDLISEVGAIFNTDLLLGRTLEKVTSVLKAERGYVMLFDDDMKLQLKASHLASGSSGGNIPISRTIVDEVISKQVGVLSSNAMSDKRFTSGKSVHNYGIRSAICVPIKGREGILGVIHLDCGISHHTYSTEQLRLLTAIGYQTGLAIENVRLHESAVQSERLAAVGETVAFLSHNIKNILQALLGGIDVVETGLQRGDLARARGGWPIVQRNLGRINEMILNMLTFSKDRQPVLENINVNHVLAECQQLIAARADERSVAIMTELDDVPPIPADAAGLHQAFMNLLTNALDAVADQRGIVTVASRYDSMNRAVVVKVIDNGSGIRNDQMELIFTPFYSSKGQRGTGLGLAVTKKIVEEHGGRIQINSGLNEGSTFTVTLPAMQLQAVTGDTDGPAVMA